MVPSLDATGETGGSYIHTSPTTRKPWVPPRTSSLNGNQILPELSLSGILGLALVARTGPTATVWVDPD